jgi:predicted ribosomally synthesized peptide with SipW-like signal peptide
MKKMNKKKTLIIGLALMLMIGLASLAYFTDVETDTPSVTAGKVSLTDNTVAVNTELMVPGDTKELNLDATYGGNVEAKVRVKLFDAVESVPSTTTEGFKLNNEEVPFDLSEDAEDVFVKLDNVNKSGDSISLPLEIELLAASKNIYQDSTLTVSYEIQVLQDGNTTEEWETTEEGIIDIVPVTEP